jgi:hypothetical protein
MNALLKFRDGLRALLFTEKFTLFEIAIVYVAVHLFVSHLHWS